MSDDRLRELYASALAARPAGTGTHPAPEAIAALVHREGAEADRLATLDHVMACAECKRDFDLLRTIERAGVEEGVAERRRTARPSWYMPAALAATLLLAVGIGSTVLPSPDDDLTRGGEAAFALVGPEVEGTAGEPITFTWRSVPGARRYELELMDGRGAVAAAAETADTTIAPAAVRSLPAGDYRWWVRATTSDARAVRSDFRPLRLLAK